jgi:SecD/SecF fusion protein
MMQLIQRLIEFPFRAVGWLFKDTYGRVIGVLLLALIACMVDYPTLDTKVGKWKVEYTLTEKFSREQGAPAFFDKTGRIDPNGIESRDVLERIEIYKPVAFLTMPFHHVEEHKTKVLSTRRDEERKHKIMVLEVERISRGLRLGLDLRGGTELIYRVQAPEGRAEEILQAQDVAEIIRRRINASGLKEPRVQHAGEDRVIVQFPGFDPSDVARIRSIITRIGRLEFRIVADREHNPAVFKALETTGKLPEGWHKYVLFQQDEDDPGKVEQTPLYISDEIGLTGEQIERASVGPGGETGSEVAVHLRFKDPDAFWRLTRANVGRRLAIMLDDVRDKDGNLLMKKDEEGNVKVDEEGFPIPRGRVQSAPVIREPILGAAEITGGFSVKEAEKLKIALQSGSLKTPLELVRERSVGPSEGLKSIQDGRRAILIGFLLVVVFIAVYYRKAGLVADCALLLNLLLLVAALALRSATLTLPGIAGVMLTIGMSIDANVLIFERIREELKKVADKPLIKCMRDGHHKALVTIIDANLTTLITSIILHEFGSGPIKGFATTLSYGIVISMFTAVVVTRVVFEALVKMGAVKSLSMMEIVRNANVPFVRIGRVVVVASVVVVVASLVWFAVAPGERLGIEFSSGTNVVLRLKEKVSADVVRDVLRRAGYETAEVQEILEREEGGGWPFSVRLRYVPNVDVAGSERIGPDGAAGAQVEVRADRNVDPDEMIRRLQLLQPADYKIEVRPAEEKYFAYAVTTDDTSPDAVQVLRSNVETVFSGELITSDIRAAFDRDDRTDLVDDGIRIHARSEDAVELAVSLKQAVRAADVQTKLAQAGLTGAAVRPAPDAETDGDGRVRDLLIAAGFDQLAKIKETLRTAGLATTEPFPEVQKIYPSVARELGAKAAVALILSLFAIIAYIWFRFEFRFGVAAAAALVHDVAIALGALALLGYEIDLSVIAALLTIIGYSLNDTIVVFDRIRENRRTVRKTAFPDIVNLSINQMLGRTILTSLTTFIAVAALYFLGGAAIRGFAFTLLVGVVAGTYSSVFIASPILLLTGEQGALRGPLSGPSARIARPLQGMRGR